MVYRNHIRSRKRITEANAAPVNQPIPGRETEMVPVSQGMGYAFGLDDWQAVRRWLTLGSATATMYASAEKITAENIDILQYALYQDGFRFIDLLVEMAARVPKYDTILIALALALSYEDNTIRITEGETTRILTAPYPVEGVVVRGQEVIFAKLRRGVGQYEDRAYDWDTLAPIIAGRDPDIERYGDVYIRDGVRLTVYSRLIRQTALRAALGSGERQQAIIRQASQLASLIANLDVRRGRGSIYQKLIVDFFDGLKSRDLAYQMGKYGQRDGYSIRDLLRLTRPIPGDPVRNRLYAWAVSEGKSDTDKYDLDWLRSDTAPEDDALRFAWACQQVKQAKTVKEVAALIREYRLPREAIERANTAWLNEKQVWEALLPDMPLTALIRNLRNLTKVGIIAPLSDGERVVVRKITGTDAAGEALVRRARVHPIAILAASVAYGQGQGRSADAAGVTASARVLEALDEAFLLAFANVEPANKRIMMGLDVSSSMSYHEHLIHAIPGLSPLVAEAAQALVTVVTEPQTYVTAFSQSIIDIASQFTRHLSLDGAVQVLKLLNRHFGSTNPGAVISYALAKKISVDAFVIYTDNEVNHGRAPSELIKAYREVMGLDARFICVALAPTSGRPATLADPQDRGMLDVVGFDTAAPQLISRFIAGEF